MQIDVLLVGFAVSGEEGSERRERDFNGPGYVFGRSETVLIAEAGVVGARRTGNRI